MSGLDMFQDTFVDERPLPRQRHPVRRFFFRLFLVLVLLCSAGALYIWRYQPLSFGDSYGVQGDEVRETQSVGGSSVVTYAAGERFEMIFSVRNTGRVPVRVTAVPIGGLGPVVASYDVEMMPRRATGYESSEAEAFRPFVLSPREERVLNLSYRFKDCGAPATAGNRTLRRQAVRYEFIQKFHRQAEVSLSQPLVILRMPSC